MMLMGCHCNETAPQSQPGGVELLEWYGTYGLQLTYVNIDITG